MSAAPAEGGAAVVPAEGSLPARLALQVLRQLSRLPYPVLRRLGDGLGVLLYVLAAPRRRIARTNLRLCFPNHGEDERRALIKAHFRYFARSFFDRFVLWYQPAERVRAMVKVYGLEHLDAQAGRPVILLAPHFLGLDAGGTRLSMDRPMFSMFANQKNKVFNEAMRAGRLRFPGSQLLLRQDGLRAAIRMMRQGLPFYFLPDMDLGSRDSLFVPFFGVSAATVPSVARLAQMTRAAVVPCVTEMVDEGYIVRLYPAWADYPGDDLTEATARMNRFIEERVLEMPAQYLWTHKRFKTRPPGEADFYGRDRGTDEPQTEGGPEPVELPR